jgi:hypothetical protein
MVGERVGNDLRISRIYDANRVHQQMKSGKPQGTLSIPGTRGTQAQYPRSAPTATFRQASRRQQGADPQQAGL